MRKRGFLHAEIFQMVPFFDVDSMNVVWHGHYVKYLEIARCALLDAIGYGYARMRDDGYAWPVIDLQLRYVRPAHFGQRLCVRADLVEWQNRLKIHYLIRDADHGEPMTRASTVQVAVRLADGAMQLVSPQALVDAIERHGIHPRMNADVRTRHPGHVPADP
jgi:acyl-CoA thioester hydrolase